MCPGAAILRCLRGALQGWCAVARLARHLDRCEYRILVRRLVAQMRAAAVGWASYVQLEAEKRRGAIQALTRTLMRSRSRVFYEWAASCKGRKALIAAAASLLGRKLAGVMRAHFGAWAGARGADARLRFKGAGLYERLLRRMAAGYLLSWHLHVQRARLLRRALARVPCALARRCARRAIDAWRALVERVTRPGPPRAPLPRAASHAAVAECRRDRGAVGGARQAHRLDGTGLRVLARALLATMRRAWDAWLSRRARARALRANGFALLPGGAQSGAKRTRPAPSARCGRALRTEIARCAAQAAGDSALGRRLVRRGLCRVAPRDPAAGRAGGRHRARVGPRARSARAARLAAGLDPPASRPPPPRPPCK